MIRRLAYRVGRRGAGLLFFALVDIVFAFALTEAPPTASYVFLAALLPLPVWAAIWGAVGLLCAVQAFMRVDRIAFAAASLLKVAWGTVYLIGWVMGAIPRGYVSVVIWLGFAGFVQLIAGWRENWER